MSLTAAIFYGNSDMGEGGRAENGRLQQQVVTDSRWLLAQVKLYIGLDFISDN